MARFPSFFSPLSFACSDFLQTLLSKAPASAATKSVQSLGLIAALHRGEVIALQLILLLIFQKCLKVTSINIPTSLRSAGFNMWLPFDKSKRKSFRRKHWAMKMFSSLVFAIFVLDCAFIYTPSSHTSLLNLTVCPQCVQYSHLCLSFLPPLSAPLAADPAKPSLAGLRLVRRADKPISTGHLQRTEGKSSSCCLVAPPIFTRAHCCSPFAALC